MDPLLRAASIAFGSALLATPILGWILARAGVLDRPNIQHKTHAAAAPSLGGVAVVAAVAIALFGSGPRPDWPVLVFAACGAVFVLGVFDDIFDLSPRVKLLAELLCAAAVCAAGMTAPFGLAWVAVPATMLWLVVCANGFNLTDGVDGLAGFAGVFGAAGIAAMATLRGETALAASAAILAGALAGFLPFNFPRARIFLGDSGALPAGFFLGICGIALARVAPDAPAAAAPLLALGLPIAEAVLSALRRALRGDAIFRADRRHIHHRLADRGLTPPQVTLWCAAYSALGALAGVAVSAQGASIVSAAVVLGFAAVSLAALRYLRYAELSCAASRLFGSRSTPLAEQIRVAEHREALENATDPERRWELIVLGLRELGFREVRLLDQSGRPLRQSSANREGLQSAWKLTVVLPEGEGVLEAERAIDDSGEARVSAALEQLLRRAFEQDAHRRPRGAFAATSSSPS